MNNIINEDTDLNNSNNEPEVKINELNKYNFLLKKNYMDNDLESQIENKFKNKNNNISNSSEIATIQKPSLEFKHDMDLPEIPRCLFPTFLPDNPSKNLLNITTSSPIPSGSGSAISNNPYTINNLTLKDLCSEQKIIECFQPIEEFILKSIDYIENVINDIFNLNKNININVN